jgi:hypothetical protein
VRGHAHTPNVTSESDTVEIPKRIHTTSNIAVVNVNYSKTLYLVANFRGVLNCDISIRVFLTFSFQNKMEIVAYFVLSKTLITINA